MAVLCKLNIPYGRRSARSCTRGKLHSNCGQWRPLVVIGDFRQADEIEHKRFGKAATVPNACQRLRFGEDVGWRDMTNWERLGKKLSKSIDSDERCVVRWEVGKQEFLQQCVIIKGDITHPCAKSG